MLEYFQFWLAKTLVEFAMLIVFLLGIGVVSLVLLLIGKLMEKGD